MVATAGLAPAPRRMSGIRSIALRRLAQTESARWAPHQGGFRMDCPRRRLRYSVYYKNPFFTTGSFDLSVILPHFEAHYRRAVCYTRAETDFSVHQLSAAPVKHDLHIACIDSLADKLDTADPLPGTLPILLACTRSRCSALASIAAL